MTAPDLPLRYLTAADVTAAMPRLDERLALAERTMTALVADAELPPKIGVHPRPDGSFAHAMPAFLRGADAAGGDDLLGMKWVAGFPANRASGLPAIHGLVVLSDAGDRACRRRSSTAARSPRSGPRPSRAWPSRASRPASRVARRGPR